MELALFSLGQSIGVAHDRCGWGERDCQPEYTVTVTAFKLTVPVRFIYLSIKLPFAVKPVCMWDRLRLTSLILTFKVHCHRILYILLCCPFSISYKISAPIILFVPYGFFGVNLCSQLESLACPLCKFPIKMQPPSESEYERNEMKKIWDAQLRVPFRGSFLYAA